jgi:hypothetical protein
MTDVLRYRIVRAPKELSAQPKRTFFYPRQTQIDRKADGKNGTRVQSKKRKLQPEWMLDDESLFADSSSLSSGVEEKLTSERTNIKTVAAQPPRDIEKANDFLASPNAVVIDAAEIDGTFLFNLVKFSVALDDVEGQVDSNDALKLLEYWAGQVIDATAKITH